MNVELTTDAGLALTVIVIQEHCSSMSPSTMQSVVNVTITSGTISGNIDVSGGTLTLADDQISGDKIQGDSVTISDVAITNVEITSTKGPLKEMSADD